MRTTNQKLKASFALKNMNQKYQQQSFQTDKHQQAIPTLSIININSCQPKPINKTQYNRKNKMFCSVIRPHKKLKTKGLQSLIQATIKLSDKQTSTSKSKSQRNKPLLVKNMSSFSQRLNSASKIVRKVSEQITKMSNQSKIMAERFDCIGFQSSKRKDDSYQNRQHEILTKQDLPQKVCQNKKSHTQSSMFLDNDPFLMQNFIKRQKEEVILKLKESLKNKQSRKHIHRVLRQTSETISKHKPKQKTIQMRKDVLQPCGISQIQNLSPLHYGLTKNNVKHFCLSNLKRLDSPDLDQHKNLKIQAKAAEIINFFSKQSQEGAIRDIYKNRPYHSYHQIKNTQFSFQIKQYNLKEQDRSSLKRRWAKQKQKSHLSAQKEKTNLFRELTPWHEDEPQ